MKFVLLIASSLLPIITATSTFDLIRRSPHVSSLFARQLDTCPTGTFPCSDGGCCNTGSTCATDSDGNQVCQSVGGCVAPPVPCGPSCCDAGTTCVMVGSQFRCAEGGAPAASPPSPTPVGGTGTVTSIPTGLVTASGTDDGSFTTPTVGSPGSNSSVPFVNGPVPGAAGTTSAGTSAAATTLGSTAVGATHIATTSLATRSVMALSCASVFFALTAWMVLGHF